MMFLSAGRLLDKTSVRKIRLGASLLAGLIVLNACSGESRPFEEAVEVQMLQLASLTITPPPRTIEPAFFGTNQTADFAVTGISTSGNAVEISGIDRQWRVSDPSVASIDDNGRLVGRSASGTPITVELVIGGIAAEPFPLTISDAPLQSISSITGSDTLDPCLAMPYSATGMYSDSMRPLTDVVWSVSPTEAAGIGEPVA